MRWHCPPLLIGRHGRRALGTGTETTWQIEPASNIPPHKLKTPIPPENDVANVGSNQTIWDNMLTSMFLYIPQVLSYVLYTCCLRACLNRIPLLNGFAMIMNASIHNHAQYEELEARIAAGDEDALIPGCNYLLYLQNDEACSILEIDLGCTPKCSMEEFGAHFFCRRLPDAFCIFHKAGVWRFLF